MVVLVLLLLHLLSQPASAASCNRPVCICAQERQRGWEHLCLSTHGSVLLLFDLGVYIVYSHLHTICALLTTVCLFYWVLPSRNCCYVRCSHLVVKHSHGSPSLPPPLLPLHWGSSLGLWCSSCLVQVFSASSHQSLPHALKSLLGKSIHILSTLPHTILFHMAGPACLWEHLSAKCERMCTEGD